MIVKAGPLRSALTEYFSAAVSDGHTTNLRAERKEGVPMISLIFSVAASCDNNSSTKHQKHTEYKKITVQDKELSVKAFSVKFLSVKGLVAGKKYQGKSSTYYSCVPDSEFHLTSILHQSFIAEKIPFRKRMLL